MNLKYRITKFSIVGLVIALLGAGWQLSAYSKYREFQQQPEAESEAPAFRPGQSFSTLPKLGSPDVRSEQRAATAKSSFRWNVVLGLFVILAGAVLMALPARENFTVKPAARPKRTR